MTSYNLALAALVIACLVLSGFDVWTTEAVFAKGGKENNRFMAWVQALLPRAWPYFRGAAAGTIAVLLLLVLPRAGAALALGAIDSVYLMVVLSNSWWARQ